MTLLLGIFNRKIRKNIDFLICAYGSEKNKVKKRAFLFFPLLMIIVFSWRLYLGFIYPGICGWTEEHTKLNSVKIVSGQEIVLLPDSLQFIYDAINIENVRYLAKGFYVKGSGMFLHFENGFVKASNKEILDFVFPDAILIKLKYNDPNNYNKLFLSAARNGLRNRRYGKTFFIHKNYAYPNHCIYNKVNYDDCPEPKSLSHISFYEFSVKMECQNIIIFDAHKIEDIL